jgi:hypothetical protein
MRIRTGLTLAALVAVLAAVPASAASETITYTYDARGRLIRVVHSGTGAANNNNQACYKYDKAGNRITVQVNVGSLTPACPT